MVVQPVVNGCVDRASTSQSWRNRWGWWSHNHRSTLAKVKEMLVKCSTSLNFNNGLSMFDYMLTFSLVNLPVVKWRRFNHHEASAPPVAWVGGDSGLDAQFGIRHFGTLQGEKLQHIGNLISQNSFHCPMNPFWTLLDGSGEMASSGSWLWPQWYTF